MKKFNIKISHFIVLGILFLFGCSEEKERTSRVAFLPFYEDASFTPHWLDPNSDELTNFHQIPDFQLVNQEGQSITEKDFEGKVYVADFFFTACPGICPKMTSNMSILQEEFISDDEVLLISHSVTPEKDSVHILKEYAQNKDIKSDKWHLVTGERKQIYNLGRHSYFVEEDLGKDKGIYDFLHTENFILIDQNRHIRGIYNGLKKTDIDQLIADIETLKLESVHL